MFPSIIQRATIVRPMVLADSFMNSLKLDNMGSSYFDWSKLVESHNRIVDSSMDYDIIQCSSISRTVNDKQCSLRLFIRGGTFTHQDYEDNLASLLAGNFVTVVPSHFDSKEWTKTDVWWDIENDVIFSFDRHYVARLPQFFRNNI